MEHMLKNTGRVISNANDQNEKEPFFMFRQNVISKPFFGESPHAAIIHTNGPPDVQKQDGGTQPQPQAATPCPSSVSVGTLASFNHSNLSAADQDTWGTYLGVASQMNVGPGPDHSGHCMKEKLTTVSNNCPAQVYSRGGATQSSPCTGDRCLDINCHSSSGDAATHSMVSDGPTAFVDLHRTRNPTSLLDGSGSTGCSVVCDQVYSCDRTLATTGKFRITRNFHAATHTKSDGTTMPITTGTVTKVVVP